MSLSLIFTLLKNPNTWIALVFGSLLLWGGIQTSRIRGLQADLKALQATYDGFVTQVRVQGETAQKTAKAKEEADVKLAKEKDAQNAEKLKNLDSQYAAYRMRVQSGSSAGSSLLPSPSKATGGANYVCYAREAFDREIASAIGRLRVELANDAQPFDKAAATLKTIQDWAR